MSVETSVHTISFGPRASLPKQAIAMIFDLEGFSRFFSQPDVHYYVPKFLNRVFEAVDVAIFGGKSIADGEELIDEFERPAHVKYLGDGGLYLWTFDEEFHEYVQSKEFVYFVNRIWNIKTHFNKLVEQCRADIPLADLPGRIRFGLAAGSVYELSREDGSEEYMGYCINLASRLQSYCRDLGFIVSARLGLADGLLEKNGYMRAVATNIKGFPKEIVIVDKKEFFALDNEVREQLFETI